MARNPKYQKAHCLILSRKPLREADFLLTVFSREQGKIRVLARGVRKANAKLAGRLQQLYNVEIYLAGSSLWPTVTSVSIINKYPKIRQSLSALAIAFYAAELVTKLTPDAEINARIYELLDRFYSELNSQSKNIEFSEKDRTWPPILEKFRLDLLRIVGHGVTTRFCAHCGVKIAAGEATAFSSFAGGGVRTGFGKIFTDTRLVSEITAGQLAILDQQALEDVADLTVGEEGHRCISDFVVFLLERDVQSERFMEKMRQE